MVKLKFISNEGEKVVEANEGLSILDVARANGINLMGACEGACACGTCHIYIDEEHLSKIEKPSESEENVHLITYSRSTGTQCEYRCQLVKITAKCDDAKFLSLCHIVLCLLLLQCLTYIVQYIIGILKTD